MIGSGGDKLEADLALKMFAVKKGTFITHGHLKKPNISYSVLIRYGLKVTHMVYPLCLELVEKTRLL